MKPSLRERISVALGVLFNRYEAAEPSSPQRAWVPAFVRDARFDANSWSRWEMSRKIRYYERNVWLVQRLRDEFSKWTVGPSGLQVIPATSDDEWNNRMLEDYLRWCDGPCLDSTISMSQVHHQMAGEHHIEGGVFIHETRRKLIGKPSEPAIQVIRGHRVTSPGVDYSPPREDLDLVDGVQLGKDSSGKVVGPIGYWVKDDFAGSEWIFRGVDVMQHVYDPEIPGMYREITPYHGVINTLGDVELLEQFEMQRAHANAEDAKIFKTVSGELPASAVIRQKFMSGTGATIPNQDADIEKRLDMYRKVLGARTIALRTNEDVVTPENRSPSAAQQWLWRYKLGQICAAVGVPLVLVFPELIESSQGTIARGIYDNAHEFFRTKTCIFARAAVRLYRFYAGWARYNRPKLVDAPADWDRCHVIPPRAVNVDVGYTSEAKIAEIKAGLTDYDTEAGAHGTTSEVIFRRKARQVALIKRIAREETQRSGEEVKPEEIAGMLSEVMPKAQPAAEPDEDDEPPKKKEAVEA